jgi:hypothetical protein
LVGKIAAWQLNKKTATITNIVNRGKKEHQLLLAVLSMGTE